MNTLALSFIVGWPISLPWSHADLYRTRPGVSHTILNMKGKRSILHVDMDAFFAAIEQLDHPDLRGKPVLVGHDGPRGVVTTASYEARPFDCHSAQPMVVARRNCPQAIVVPVRSKRYREVSNRVFEILRRFTDLVEPVSIDEAFLDVEGSRRLLGDSVAIATRIKKEIFSELKIRASIGVAPNKFLAKLGSDLKKPDALVVIDPDHIDEVLLPLPISRIWGLGPAAVRRFEQMQVSTIADLRRVSLDRLVRKFGKAGHQFHRLARGIDSRPVVPDQKAKSISEENTFGEDLSDPGQVRTVLLAHVEAVARRLRKNGLQARRITLKIRFGDFQTISRSETLNQPTNLTQPLWQSAATLFDHWAKTAFQPVRLIGMGVGDFVRDDGQLDLFNDLRKQKQQRLDTATDRITDRFGACSIRRGTEGTKSKERGKRG